MTTLADWLERHTSQAPVALRARVRDLALTVDAGATLPDALAEAGRRGLGNVVAHPGDRSVALDLLAADALVTLALLAQAQIAPERLGDFAATVLHSGSARP
ncbi:MAG TPA: hypothetical protein VIG08_15640 [Gemmatimonadales bacterium]